MADSKASTPPPLLLMPASEGLTLSPASSGNLLMPVPQTEASLLSPEEEAEADSFIGQTPPNTTSTGSAPFSYFQQPSSNLSSSDPFAQVRQPENIPHFDQRPVSEAVPFSQHNPPAPSVSAPFQPASQPQPPVQPPASLSGPGIRPPPPSAQVSANPHRISKRPQYAQPPAGTYAQPAVGTYAPGSNGHSSQPAPPPPTGVQIPPTTQPLGSLGSSPPPPSFGSAPPTQGFLPASNHAPPQPGLQFPPKPSVNYIPVRHHWFYCNNVSNMELWEPFSMADSVKLEEAFRLGETDIVSTDGGRYDVEVSARLRRSVFWDEEATPVRRCSWFFRPDDGNRFIPYDEEFAVKLEDEYKVAVTTDSWHKRLEFPNGETIVMHNPHVFVQFPAAAQPDQWGTAQGTEMRPKVVKRGTEDFDNIRDGEQCQIDHVIFVVHGVGPTCDLRFRNIVECVNDFRRVSEQILESHFKRHQDEGRIGRVEFLPVRWHSALHSDATGVDRRLKAITLNSISKLRNFTNDTLLDILFYASPAYAQKISDTVCEEINRMHQLFTSRNPDFNGAMSVAGHSLGSLILFDLLAHQQDTSQKTESSENSLTPVGSASSLSAHQDIRGSPASSTRNSTPCKELFSEQEDEVQTLEQLLSQLGLSDFMETFKKEQIDLESLTLCEESDIKEMGLPMGPRKKLQGYIKLQKQKQATEQRDSEAAVKKEAEMRAKIEAEQQAASHKSEIAVEPLFKSSSNTSIDFVVSGSGTGAPLVHYPQLNFTPVNFFALGSPIAMFLTVRGVENLGEEFRFPTCSGFFNVFHPFDPVAYRVEPLIGASIPPKPMLMPHHKGRKRLHLELRESLARYGTDIKQRIIDSVKSTWRSINSFAMAHRTTAPQAPVDSPEEVEQQVDSVLSQMTQEEQDRFESSSVASSMPDEDFLQANLNQGRRVDYVLQEKPIESFNDYLFALSSHLCYWDSEDTLLLLLKETYALQGISPIKPGKDSAQSPLRPPPMFPRPPGGLTSPQAPVAPPPSSFNQQSQPPVGLPGGGGVPPRQQTPARPPMGYIPSPFSVAATSPSSTSTPPRPAHVGPPPMTGFVNRK